MSDYREAWEGAISVCRERNDEITRLRAEIADLTKANALLHGIVSNREEEISGLRAELVSASERVAEMQAEAGMYHSLYDVATERLASARKALEPFAKELERQERVRSYRDGDCILADCRLTIGDLRRLPLTDEEGHVGGMPFGGQSL